MKHHPIARHALRALALLLSLVALLAAGPASSSTEPEWSYRLWNEMMSPFCPGRSLADCPSGQADSLRMWILTQEAAGASRAEVEAQLYERYGDVILAAPRAEGFGLTAYVMPVVVFVAGGVLLAVFLRRRTGAPEASTSPRPVAEPLDPDLERLVDEELAR